jgi:Ca-activated chloride channel family protein
LNLKEEQSQQTRKGEGSGQGEFGAPRAAQRQVRVDRKGVGLSRLKTLRNLLGSFGKSSVGRHDTPELSTGVESALASKLYEFGDTINLDVIPR